MGGGGAMMASAPGHVHVLSPVPAATVLRALALAMWMAAATLAWSGACARAAGDLLTAAAGATWESALAPAERARLRKHRALMRKRREEQRSTGTRAGDAEWQRLSQQQRRQLLLLLKLQPELLEQEQQADAQSANASTGTSAAQQGDVPAPSTTATATAAAAAAAESTPSKPARLAPRVSCVASPGRLFSHAGVPLADPPVAPSLPFEEWRHRPVLIRPAGDAAGLRCSLMDGATDAEGNTLTPSADGALPMGVPFRFESPLFEGVAIVRARGIPGGAYDRAYFSGRRRALQVCYQGRFRRPLPVGDMRTGHEFARPLRLPPHYRRVVALICRFVSAVVPGIVIDTTAQRPYARSSFAATVQAMRVDLPGEEPDVRDHNIAEDCRRLGGIFANRKVSASKRKRLLAARGGGGYIFDTKHVYTFDTYDHVLKLDDLSLRFPAVAIHMADGLDGQPLHFMARDQRTGEYVWSFECWHEATLAVAEARRAEEREATACAAGALGA